MHTCCVGSLLAERPTYQWPYTYEACDVGTVANQSINGEPAVVLSGNDNGNDGRLSFLPGQRLSACTCGDDDTHPGPKDSKGNWVGRAAPEIDIFEAQVGHVTPGNGEVSQSAQWAVSIT
jgi:beta-glucanase (GH16 family)